MKRVVTIQLHPQEAYFVLTGLYAAAMAGVNLYPLFSGHGGHILLDEHATPKLTIEDMKITGESLRHHVFWMRALGAERAEEILTRLAHAVVPGKDHRTMSFEQYAEALLAIEQEELQEGGSDASTA